MFGTFFFILMAFYTFYYVGMIGYDLYAAEKGERSDRVVQDVDISGATASYVPVDVRSMYGKDDSSSADAGDATVSPTSFDGGSGGGADMSRFIGSDYQNECSVDDITNLFTREAQTPSLFAGVNTSFL